MALAVTLVIVVAVYLLWRDAKPLLLRRVAIAEKRASIEDERVAIERLALIKPVVKDEDPMPPEFVQWAMQEASEWAREDMLTRMRELYARLGDWQKVRSALMAEDDANLRSTF
jgi:hypothetical protein